MRGFFVLFAVSTAGLAWCGPGKKAPSRVDAIWDAVQSRVGKQADIYFDAGDYPASANLLRFLVAADSSNYEANDDLGWMQENMGHYDQALATYVRYRKTNPSSLSAPFPEAFFYFSNKAYAKVPPLLEPIIHKHPDADTFRLLAHSYEKLGLYPDAVRVWKLYLADNPKDETAQRNMAKAEGRIKAAGK